MSTNNTYIPIDCNFYDYLEEASTMNRVSSIEHEIGEDTHLVKAKIIDLVVEDHVEYMLLDNGMRIPLNRLVSFDGKPVPKSC